MNKQCLDISQMQHLQKLGLDIKSSMRWYRFCYNNGKEVVYDEWELVLNREDPWKNIHFPWRGYIEFIFTFTLQDILDLLPKDILKGNGTLNYASLYIDYESNRIAYGNTDRDGFEIYYEVPIYENIIDAAYEMLCWAIENKFVETKKNE